MMIRTKELLEKMESVEADGVDFYESWYDFKHGVSQSYTKETLEKLQDCPGSLRKYWKMLKAKKNIFGNKKRICSACVVMYLTV